MAVGARSSGGGTPPSSPSGSGYGATRAAGTGGGPTPGGPSDESGGLSSTPSANTSRTSSKGNDYYTSCGYCCSDS